MMQTMVASQKSQDLFLTVYFVVVILVTFVGNVLVLMAVYRNRKRNYYHCLMSMCLLDLCAGITVLPCMIAIIADRRIISGELFDGRLCQFIGVFAAFLHRTSTSNLCTAYVDRYILIWKPMAYTSSCRSIFCGTATTCNVLIAITSALAPFAAQETNTWAYMPLSEAPVCIFTPKTEAGKVILYIDVVYSYGIMWTIMLSSILGMLFIACMSSSAKRRVVPISLGTITGNQRGSKLLKDRRPSAWFTEASNSAVCQSGPNTPRCSRTRNGDWSTPNVTCNEIPASYVAKRIMAQQPNRKRKCAWENIDNDFEPGRKMSIIATNVTLCDELTLCGDGSARLRSRTITTTNATECIPFSVHREITFEQSNLKENGRQRKFVFSSLLRHNHDADGKSLIKTDKTTTVKTPLNTRKRKNAIRKLPQRSSVLQQMNTKAFVNLTLTLFAFTLLTLPVFLLHITLAAAGSQTQESNSYPLGVIFSMAMATIYFAYPLLVVMADKEMKDTITRVIKRHFEGNSLEGEIEQSNASLDF